MEQKIKLFIDADDTILESSKTTINILNKRFNISPPKTYDDISDWGYRSIYHQCTNEIVNEIYDSEEFFEQVKIHSNFMDFYNKYQNNFEWYIVTKGHERNINHKESYFAQHMPVATVIGCQFNSHKNENYDKSHIDMSYGIQIDDRLDCLLGTNAPIKILIKNDKELYWNQTHKNNEPIYIVNNWNEAIEILTFMLEHPEMVAEEYSI